MRVLSNDPLILLILTKINFFLIGDGASCPALCGP